MVLEKVARLHEEAWSILKNREALGSMSPKERAAAAAKGELYNAMVNRFSLSPQSAVRGLYVVGQPRLGLSRVPAPAR